MKINFTVFTLSVATFALPLFAQQNVAPLQVNPQPTQSQLVPMQNTPMVNQPSPEELQKQKEAARKAKKDALEKQLFGEIKPQTEKIGLTFFEKHKYHLLGIVVAIVVVSLLLFKSKKIKTLTPYQSAKLRFDIVAKNSDALDVKPYAEEVSQIVRDYIDKVYNIPAPERTTEEFLEIASQSEVFADKAKEELASILKLADMAKFAKHAFSKNERMQIFETSVKFVEDDYAASLANKKEK